MSLSPAIRELRVHFSPTDKGSLGLLTFVKRHYIDLKRSNPNLPINVRESKYAIPRIIARLDLGKEESFEVAGLTEPEIKRIFRKLENL